jgi:MFS family permease
MGESEILPGPSGIFAYPDLALYQIARFFIVGALEMQSVAVGWQVYEITRRPLDLGLVGLAQFLPGVFLFLVAGHAADRHDRKRLLNICYCGFVVCSGLLLFATLRGIRSVHFIYAVLLFLGVVRCFNWPASRALLPQLVPMEYFSKAVAWNASTFQAATILGPAIGGVLYAAMRGPSIVYGGATLSGVIALLATLRITSKSQVRPAQDMSLHTVMAGFRYVWREKVVLGSISLDMFAVLLGGAVALLPVYASEILKTGPWGLGLLRSAPGIGAAMMAIFLAKRPIQRRAGAIMLWCVAGFGVFTILFGVSRSLMLSMIALLLVGATDMVSVIIRATLVQFATPDEMRGRVNAVDMLFIGASNELGEFESGLTAHWFGTVPAVVLGGVGTLIVIGLWAWLFPELRKADQI